MALRFVVAAFAAITAIATALAAPPASAHTYLKVRTLYLNTQISNKSNWALEAPGGAPAKLCFWANKATCILITGRAENGAPVLNYSHVKSLRVAQIAPQQKAVVLDALFPNDLRMSVQTSVWTYDRENDGFVPALTFALTEVGGYQIFASGPLAGHVVTAEFVLGENEDKYGSHRFLITVHRWIGSRFVQVLSYVTPQRYTGETEEADDDVDGPVIPGELPRIRALLKQVYPQTRLPKS